MFPVSSPASSSPSSSPNCPPLVPPGSPSVVMSSGDPSSASSGNPGSTDALGAPGQNATHPPHGQLSYSGHSNHPGPNVQYALFFQPVLVPLSFLPHLTPHLQYPSLHPGTPHHNPLQYGPVVPRSPYPMPYQHLNLGTRQFDPVAPRAPHPTPSLAQVPHVGHWSVKQNHSTGPIRIHGLTQQVEEKKRRPYTEDEVKILRKNYEEYWRPRKHTGQENYEKIASEVGDDVTWEMVRKWFGNERDRRKAAAKKNADSNISTQ